ncbi:DUF448 domain-containing protein [bacterium]|nr:DUF448 domain-containing protein [bacterium]MBU1990503.1 DUF448 domain-containing protein [bacterium]
MAKKFHQPVRMCVSCRQRDSQENLFRLQCTDGSLESYKGNGRSFYICKNCLLEDKKVIKALMRQCKSGERDKFTNKLKEIIADDRKS